MASTNICLWPQGIQDRAYLSIGVTSGTGGLRGVPGQGDSKGIGAGICKILHLNFREFLFRDCPKRGTNNALSANLDVLGGENGSKSAVLVLCKATGQAPLTLFGQSLRALW